MTKSLQYLEKIQGLVLFLQEKYKEDISAKKLDISLKKLIELPEDIFIERVEEYEKEYKIVLKKYFEEVLPFRKDGIRRICFKEKMDELYARIKDIEPEQIIKELTEYLEKYEDQSLLISKFEPISYYQIIKILRKNVEDFAERTGNPNLKNIAIGTMSTRSINACAIGIENEDNIIILERDLMHLLHLTTKIILQCFNKDISRDDKLIIEIDIDAIISRIENNVAHPALTRFKDLIVSYLVKGSPRSSEQYLLRGNLNDMLQETILMGAEFFVIGHELGHIIKRHNINKRKIFFFNPEKDSELKNSNWTKEFEADYLGLLFMMHSLIKYEFGNDFHIGAEMVLIIYDIVSKAQNLYEFGNEEGSKEIMTHPPYEKRIDNIRKELMKFPDDEQKDRLANALSFADSIRTILEYLWNAIKPDILSLYQKKKQEG